MRLIFCVSLTYFLLLGGDITDVLCLECTFLSLTFIVRSISKKNVYQYSEHMYKYLFQGRYFTDLGLLHVNIKTSTVVFIA